MAVAKKPYQEPFHHITLANDYPVHLLEDAINHQTFLLDPLTDSVNIY
jgi:hypothetical protein